MDAILARIWGLATTITETEGMEIVDIELHRGGTRGGKVLRVYLDKPGGTNVDDLSRVSRQLSALLDEHDLVEGTYTL